jgi:tRNA modification GTPase
MQAETIAAIATPPGRGGVGIVRISGSKASTIASQLTNQSIFVPRSMNYVSFSTKEGTLLDQGLVVYFKAPHSYTGEDVIEFQAHGSPIILDCLLQECLACGARLAKPGEFSERAFLNDKIDLTQAEAIADLIEASSLTAARMAVRSLQGDFSKQINALNEKIMHLRMYVEAAIDFPEEEVDFLGDGIIAQRLDDLLKDITTLRAQATQGAILREGLSIVIAGKPNAGKSTLINALAGREVAIVTHIAGTTRDVMKEQVLLGDLPVHLIDTAGLRDSEDLVEKEGIKRAWEAVRQADCVLMVIDIHNQHEFDLEEPIRRELPKNVAIITVYNKIDSKINLECTDSNAIYLSAKSGQGLDSLITKIKEVVQYHPAEGLFIARRRHLMALDQAIQFLQTGQQQLQGFRAGELLAEDLRQAHLKLGEIVGEFTSDDLLGKIFSSFCIGK